MPPTIDSTPGTAASPDEETFAVTGDISPDAPAEESRRAVPPDAPRTQPPARDEGRAAEREQTADTRVRSSSRAGTLALDSSPVFATGSTGNLVLRVS